ncbi:MAG: stage 0 sporulation protein [Oscillospiraceae bacterium]|nr:stage 0 sporulation protein [Oscillospiraceae bacterium]
MSIAVKVKLEPRGKIYNFDCNLEKCEAGQLVVVETPRGVECGKVIPECPRRCCKKDDSGTLENKIIRIATKEDLKKVEENRRKSREALKIFAQKIKKYELDMKPIDVKYTLDSKKIIFYFSADERIDFRVLVKDLAYFFHVRIELRQIGIRDETKVMGGIGICGKPFCCCTFLSNFQPVLIKTAKDQGIFLSPSKISGNCGRLMCCLKYEEESYAELAKTTPPVCSTVLTEDGEGIVMESNLLTGMIKVQIKKTAKFSSILTLSKEDVKIIKRVVKKEELCENINEDSGKNFDKTSSKESNGKTKESPVNA